MKLSYKFLLINIGVAVLITIFIALMYQYGANAADIGIVFGVICLVLALANLFIGLLLALIPERRQIGKALLLSGAVLLLLSGISCGTSFSNAKF